LLQLERSFLAITLQNRKEKKNMRKITKLRRSIKAISPVISVLLMIAIAVVASLVAYAWVMGYIGFQTAKTGQAIQIQSYAPNTGNNQLMKIYVQNVGQGIEKVDSVYINDKLVTITSPTDLTVGIGQTLELTVDLGAGNSWNTGQQVKIKVVTTGGTFSQVTGTGTSNANPTAPPGGGNTAPVLDSIGAKSVDEGVLLTFTASATDADLPAQTLTYSATDLPSGATFNAGTRTFSWTPAEAQGPGTYDVTFSVSDGAGGSDSEVVTITVAEVNQAPVLTAISDKTVDELTQLTFTATATDSDIPAQTLTYSLISAPTGASIDSSTGVFTWTPTEAQGVGDYTFTVRVTDNGSPAQHADQTVHVHVNEVATILLNDGFEATGNAWDDNWDGHGTTNWVQSSTQVHSGTYSARSDSTHEGDLTTDTLSTSGATSVTVSFWLYHTDISGSDLTLYFRSTSNSYVSIADLGNYGNDNAWTYYTITSIDSHYLQSDFRVRLTTSLGSGEYVYVDDVVITTIP
jgi:flagellin-like protein